MQKYEGCFILEVPLESAQENFKKIDKILKTHGAIVTETREIGQKTFAYPINKKTEGVYFFILMEAPPSFVQDSREDLQLEKPLLRYLIDIPKELRLRKRKLRKKKGATPVKASVESKS